MIEKNALTKDMKKVMVKLKVLKIIGIKRTYPYAIVKEIAQSKHMAQFFSSRDAIKDEIYNTINVLEKAGYIRLANSGSRHTGQEKHSKPDLPANYYTITKEGKAVLNSTKKIFISSMKEISDMFK